MGLPNHSITEGSSLTEAELNDWEEAYAAVEAYLLALRLKNRLLVAELVRRVLMRAEVRYDQDTQQNPRNLALEEVLNEVSNWVQAVLDIPLENRRLAARGRLALLLAGMPDKWKGVFLTPAPWPEEFVTAMNQSYMDAGPRFAALTMTPQPLELNAIGSGAAQWWDTMDRKPIIRIMFVSALICIVAYLTWFIYFD